MALKSNPTELRNITAQMKYWLNAMCEERRETLEAWDDVKGYLIDIEMYDKADRATHYLKNSEKWLKIALKSYNEKRKGLMSYYKTYQKLNKQRKALMQPKKIKQLSFQL